MSYSILIAMNAYTDLEQSRKLAEILPIESADMFWKNGISDKYIQCFTPFVRTDTNMDYDYDVPCWSLSVLLDALPRIEHLRPSIDLNPKLDSNEVAIYYHSEDSPYIVRDNLIDAAFEMVMWLKENKKI